MTDQQINKAIARHLGWKRGHSTGLIMPIWISPSGKAERVPDYCNDLNAMVSAPIGFSHMGGYGEELRIAAGCVGPRGGHFVPNAFGILAVANLTARQRAEAFLRAIGKMEDGQ